MKLYVERRYGMIHISQKVNTREIRREQYRAFKTVKDTSGNYQEILRWSEVVGHTLEEH